ncbi:Protein phosphatase 1 regulatory subunit 3D, partial [Cladochytrium tenue]
IADIETESVLESTDREEDDDDVFEATEKPREPPQLPRYPLRVAVRTQPTTLFLSLGASIAVDSIRMDDNKGKLAISLFVRNLTYEKQVSVRYTFDAWRTAPAKETQAFYAGTVASSSNGVVGIDRFVAYLDVESALSRVPFSSAAGPASEIIVEFAARVVMDGVAHWDNNGGSNHKVCVRRSRVAMPQIQVAPTSSFRHAAAASASLCTKLRNNPAQAAAAQALALAVAASVAAEAIRIAREFDDSRRSSRPTLVGRYRDSIDGEGCVTADFHHLVETSELHAGTEQQPLVPEEPQSDAHAAASIAELDSPTPVSDSLTDSHSRLSATEPDEPIEPSMDPRCMVRTLSCPLPGLRPQALPVMKLGRCASAAPISPAAAAASSSSLSPTFLTRAAVASSSSSANGFGRSLSCDNIAKLHDLVVAGLAPPAVRRDATAPMLGDECPRAAGFRAALLVAATAAAVAVSAAAATVKPAEPSSPRPERRQLPARLLHHHHSDSDLARSAAKAAAAAGMVEVPIARTRSLLSGMAHSAASTSIGRAV